MGPSVSQFSTVSSESLCDVVSVAGQLGDRYYDGLIGTYKSLDA